MGLRILRISACANFSEGRVAVIEWADARCLAASGTVEITIAHQPDETRLITITTGARYHQLFEQWQNRPTAGAETAPKRVTTWGWRRHDTPSPIDHPCL
jgi:hypothetical protein